MNPKDAHRFFTAIAVFAAFSTTNASLAAGQSAKGPQTILFGAAYYEEYAPTDRLDEDVRMMKATGITVVRIAESTWGTLEPKPGVFDFSHVDRVLTAMDKAGIWVIVGTPTYAIPTWLAREHPEVLVVTPKGPAEYGRRQNMDITNPVFREAAQQVIVALVDHVKDHPSVIGYQVDNETKAYETSGPNVQAAFVKWMQQRYPDLAAMNKEFGLDYWSNRVNDWSDFPSVNGSINASLSSAFAEFQRGLVTEYLAWQAALVREHARKDQFVTQNFDLEWRGYSYGIQPAVDHFAAARAMDIAGIDIYHPTQDHLTGAEIAFGGDLARSMRGGQNYLVMETEAQGFPEWTPYPGQLRLQAFSHLASGANMVEYWHWGSTANAIETYWRGLLSQDFKPNPTYDEAGSIGRDLSRLGPQLVNMRKHNRIAIYFSNQALTGFNAFRFGWTSTIGYNDVLRPFYDALYRMNAEADFIDPSTTDLSAYKLILVPALYSASDAEIERLNAFAKAGGHLLYTFKSGFSDEHVKVRSSTQPGLIAEAAGVQYNQFTIPDGVSLEGDPYHVRRCRQHCALVDGATDTDDGDYSRALPPSGLGQVRGCGPQQLWQRRGDLRRLHAKRCTHGEDCRGMRETRRSLGRAAGTPLSDDRAQRYAERWAPCSLPAQLFGYSGAGDLCFSPGKGSAYRGSRAPKWLDCSARVGRRRDGRGRPLMIVSENLIAQDSTKGRKYGLL